MNSQFIAGQPPPNDPMSLQYPPNPQLNNGTPYSHPNMPGIDQKMQSLNLGSLPPPPSSGHFNGQGRPPVGQPPFGQPQPGKPPGPPTSFPGHPPMQRPNDFNSNVPGMGMPPLPRPPSTMDGNQTYPPASQPPATAYGPTGTSPQFPPMSNAPQSRVPPPQGLSPQSVAESQNNANMPPFPNQPGGIPNRYPAQTLPPASSFQAGPPPLTQQPQQTRPNQMPPPTGPSRPTIPPLPNRQNYQPGPPTRATETSPPGGFPPQPPAAGFHQPGAAPPPGFPQRPPGNVQSPPTGYNNQQPGYGTQPAGYPPQQQQGHGYQGQQPGYPGQQQAYPGHHQPAYPGQQPPFPGQQPSYPGQQDPYGYQQQPSKKLNPDQMPSPIQVMTDDQAANGGVFSTNQKGRVPPLVTTDFVVVDQGNASPRYIRSSLYSVPATNELMKQAAVPFCLVVSPMAEEAEGEQPPPLLDFSLMTGVAGTGPIRCGRCKAYMCPSMRFVDAGRHFQCAFCKATTEVPMEYTQYLNNGQQYGQSVPEMSLGCYEIVATKEYCRNNTLPNPPAVIFVIDVSYNAIRSGMVQLVIGQLRSLLADLKTPPRIGVITYSSIIHFYNINQNLGQPQMLVVGDIHDVFVPLSHGLLVEPGQADHLLDALAQQIPLMFKDNKETETILLPAVQAGLEALKAADCCGKLLIFHSSLPSAQAPGQLLNRDDRKVLGTEKERTILTPQTKAYNEVAQECVGAGCGIDLFLFNNAYIDIATIGQLARLTGGGVHKYTYFQAEFDGERVVQDLARVLSRPTAYDAVMRVRTSTGVRATDFYGHFFMSNTTDVELAALDSDKAIAVEVKHDDKLTEEDGVYVQVALLYTHITGQRRLRICNLALNVANQMADLYRCVDLDTYMNFLAKQAVAKLNEHPPKQIKENIIGRCATTLACYRKHCASPSAIGQLVLPESMKLMPLYANCLLRSDALSGGSDMSCDDRSWAMQTALSADVETSVVMLYPRLLCLNPLANDNPPEPLRCIAEKLHDDSIFLLENSVHMMMWIGLQTNPELIHGLFGVKSVVEINTEAVELPVLDTQFNESVRDLISSIRRQRRRCMRLTFVRQNDKLEMVFRHFLVEDDGRSGASSYMDFLCHLHKEIRGML